MTITDKRIKVTLAMLTEKEMTRWEGRTEVFVPCLMKWKYVGSLTEEDKESIEWFFKPIKKTFRR